MLYCLCSDFVRVVFVCLYACVYVCMDVWEVKGAWSGPICVNMRAYTEASTYCGVDFADGTGFHGDRVR